MNITQEQAVEFWRGIAINAGYNRLVDLLHDLMMYRADPELFDALMTQTRDVPDLADQWVTLQSAVDRSVASIREILSEAEEHEPA